MRKRHLWLGIGFWGLAAMGIWSWSTSDSLGEPQRVTSELRKYWTSQRRVVRVRLPHPRRLAIGDPVVTVDGAGFEQIGEVDGLFREGSPLPDREAVVSEATLTFYAATPPIGPKSQLTLFETPDTLAWVAETLLPKERTREVASVLQRYFALHREQMFAALRPVVENMVRDALSAIQTEFPVVFQRHRAELERLGRDYQESVFREQLLPIIKRDIWPLVQIEAEPLAAEIGWELWNRLSLWSFGWRMTYDWMPLTGQELVRREWNRFLRDEVRPVLNTHQGDFLEIVRQAAFAMAHNEDVRRVIGGSLTEMLANPKVQTVLVRFFDELIIQNGRLRDVVSRRWQSDETQKAIQVVSVRMEPAAQHVGQIVLGSIEDGLTPEFVAVLRTRILSKDQRWIMLENATPAPTPSADLPELTLQLATTTRTKAGMSRPPRNAQGE